MNCLRLYHEATEEPYSFLFIDATARTPKDMFWLRFETEAQSMTKQKSLSDAVPGQSVILNASPVAVGPDCSADSCGFPLRCRGGRVRRCKSLLP
jgi:hypothetical protein